MGRINFASILAAVFLVLSMVALNVDAAGAEMAIAYALCGIVCAILAHLK